MNDNICFRHYSQTHIPNFYNTTPGNWIKPAGLYFALNDSWIRQCDEMGCAPTHYEVQYDLEIQICSTSISIGDFVKLYKSKYQSNRINWPSIKADGVHISNSVILEAKQRIIKDDMSLSWASSFDIETLVVWNASNLTFKGESDMKKTDSNQSINIIKIV
jgi:hypothetical protein